MSEQYDESGSPQKPAPRPMPLVLHLERGGPWDTLTSDMAWCLDAARRYVADEANDPTARERVRAVWLEGKYRSAWHGRYVSPQEVM